MSSSSSRSPSRKRQKTAPVPEEVVPDIPATQSTETISCPICLDSWSSNGPHRLVSLKCGHLFGQLCIEKWLGTRDTCPQCNGKARKGDIRAIYAKIVCAVDTTERDDAICSLETEKQKRNKLEQLHLTTSMQCQVFASENRQLRKENEELKARLKLGMVTAVPPVNGHGFFVPLRSILVSSEKKCTVFSCDNHTGMIAVAKSLEDCPGKFGVLKISSLDITHHEFVPLHSNQIRDLAFDPHGNTRVLSCSKNKELKLTCMRSNTTLVSYTHARECWSCGWCPARPEQLLCGLQNGEVLLYDTRNTRSALTKIAPATSQQKCPVVSVISPAKDILLVSTLQCMTLYKADREGKMVGTVLSSPPGAVSSVSYEPSHSLVLASYKPGTKYPRERHVLMSLDTEAATVEEVQTFFGSTQQTVRSRSSLMRCPDNDQHVMVCAGNQADGVVSVWTRPTAGNKDCLQKLECAREMGPILAVGGLRTGGSDHLVALTNQRVVQYKWQVPAGHLDKADFVTVDDNPIIRALNRYETSWEVPDRH